MMKNNRGITLISLTIMIIVLLILSSITIYYGKENIDRANLENLKTNMLLIKTKAKEYCEEANFLQGVNPTDETKTKAKQYLTEKLSNLTDGTISDLNGKTGDKTYEYTCKLQSADLQNMGLKDVDDSDSYCIGFNVTNNIVDVYTAKGYTTDENITYYALSDLENL